MTFEQLHADMVAAMKARDKERKGVISTLIADVKKAAIDQGSRDNIEEGLVDAVILKSLKTAKEQLDTCPEERTALKAEYATESSGSMKRRAVKPILTRRITSGRCTNTKGGHSRFPPTPVTG